MCFQESLRGVRNVYRHSADGWSWRVALDQLLQGMEQDSSREVNVREMKRSYKHFEVSQGSLVPVSGTENKGLGIYCGT